MFITHFTAVSHTVRALNECFLIIMMKYIFSGPVNTVNQMQQWCLAEYREHVFRSDTHTQITEGSFVKLQIPHSIGLRCWGESETPISGTPVMPML